MAFSYEHLHAEAIQQYALAHHHLTKLKDVLDQMATSRSPSGPLPTSQVRCVREWTDYLAANGPSLKPDIHKATGIKFTERGGQHTVDWHTALEDAADNHFAANTIMKINALPEGKRGAPRRIYFLWSQRYDVRPKFGVGPERPDTVEVDVYGEPAQGTVFYFRETPTAVVDRLSDLGSPPPPETHSNEIQRYATMAEWDEAWADTFDFLATYEAKPTDEQKQEMRDTCPEGADANAAMAIAHRAAKQRSTHTLLGVISPPAGGDVRHHLGMDRVEDWEGEQDKRGWFQDPLAPVDTETQN